MAEIEDEETDKEYDSEKDNSLTEPSTDDERKDKTDQEGKRKESKKSRKAGKQKGAQGFGRTQKIPVAGTVIHNATECSVCGRELSEEDWDVELTEWHLVGPMLLSLICCLAMRMRLSRGKIREESS